jgi:Homeodomain-like domain-containing protein
MTARECQQLFGFSNGAWHSAVQRGEITTRAGGKSKSRGETRQLIAALLDEGMSQAAIANELGLSRPTVCFHMRKLGIPRRADLARRYNWNEIRAFYEQGHSTAECQRRFGFGRDAWRDAVDRGDIEPRPRLEPLPAVLAAGRRRSRKHVKLRLLSAGLKEPRCEGCDLTDWRGQPISFELHHVNGDGLDNRLENLLLLCPNCHSQTDTWGGRNKARRTAA